MHRKISGWWVVFVVGMILTVLGLLPLSINATKQCHDNTSTLKLPDGSHCIIGARIGPPIWMIGASLTTASILALIIKKARTE